MNRLKTFFGIFFLFTVYVFFAQVSVTVCSWSLENFGNSKTTSVIATIVNTVKDYDVIAIQEIVAENDGDFNCPQSHTVINFPAIKYC